jgi:antitoxin (DNA-binding transcriptional repressor) of toxin-antitoxin stability system
MYHMKRVSVRDLRYNFPKVERTLRAGKEIQLTKRNRVIARIVPEPQKLDRPDVMARLREMWGDRVFALSGTDLISAEREGR